MVHQAFNALPNYVALNTERIFFKLFDETRQRFRLSLPGRWKACDACYRFVGDPLEDLNLQQHFFTGEMVQHEVILSLVHLVRAIETEERLSHSLHVLLHPVWKMLLENVLDEILPVLSPLPAEAAESG